MQLLSENEQKYALLIWQYHLKYKGDIPYDIWQELGKIRESSGISVGRGNALFKSVEREGDPLTWSEVPNLARRMSAGNSNLLTENHLSTLCEWDQERAAPLSIKDLFNFWIKHTDKNNVLISTLNNDWDVFYGSSMIPQLVRADVRESFAIPLNQDILMFRDTSRFNTKDQGLVITEGGILLRPDRKRPTENLFFPWEDIEYTKYIDNAIHFYTNDKKHFRIPYNFFIKQDDANDIRIYLNSLSSLLNEIVNEVLMASRSVSPQDKVKRLPKSIQHTQKEKNYKEEILFCMGEKGYIAKEDRIYLERQRKRFGVSEERANKIERQVVNLSLKKNEREYLETYKELTARGEMTDQIRRLLERERNFLNISEHRAAEIENLGEI